MNPFEEMMRKMAEGGGGRSENSFNSDPDQLRHAYFDLTEKFDFKPGDLAEWKPLMKNKKVPMGSPMVITRVLDTPVVRDDPDEILDLFVGMIVTHSCGDPNCNHEPQTFVEYPMDSRRLKRYGDA